VNLMEVGKMTVNMMMIESLVYLEGLLLDRLSPVKSRFLSLRAPKGRGNLHRVRGIASSPCGLLAMTDCEMLFVINKE
jgi:hypothetical protein